MLMWHGLSDAAILATSSVGYYEGVEKLMGGRALTQDFFRLFLIRASITVAAVRASPTSTHSRCWKTGSRRDRRRT